MSLALKFTSLAIRTLAKPIGNFIKHQAREHEGFKRTCVAFAQSLHRVDMRWRLGLLQDSAAIEKQVAKDAAQEAAKKKQSTIPTVKTEAQAKADEKASTKADKDASSDSSKPRPQPKIRPLSEAKAIESGANFISEAFLFSVAAGLLLFESFRSRRKESNRRDVVADRISDLEDSEKAARKALVELEKEVLRLRAKEAGTPTSPTRRILPREVYEAQDKDTQQEEEIAKGWLTRIVNFVSNQPPLEPAAEGEIRDENLGPGPATQILAESDKAIEEKHRQQAARDAVEEEEKSRKPSIRSKKLEVKTT